VMWATGIRPERRLILLVILLVSGQANVVQKRCGRLLGGEPAAANPVWGRGGVGT